MPNYKYIVGIPCINNAGVEKILDLIIGFTTEKIRDEIVDNGFDSVIENLNKIIKIEYGSIWSVNDAPELNSISYQEPDIAF